VDHYNIDTMEEF